MTVSNLGMYPMESFQMIIPPEQSAALAIGADAGAADGPRGPDRRPAAALVALSVDHRMINGAEAAEFLSSVKKTLGDAMSHDGYAIDFLLDLYRRMVLIRRFEERVKYLFLEGIMPGTIHQCNGQEACAVGVCAALGPADVITSTHRPHGHALAKGIDARAAMGELFGRTTGCCKGKGGSMHLGDLSQGHGAGHRHRRRRHPHRHRHGAGLQDEAGAAGGGLLHRRRRHERRGLP